MLHIKDTYMWSNSMHTYDCSTTRNFMAAISVPSGVYALAKRVMRRVQLFYVFNVFNEFIQQLRGIL